MVDYSAAAINHYYGLENYEIDPYHTSKSFWDADVILRYISIPEGRWKTTEQAFSHKLPSKYKLTEQRAWHRFIGVKLLPTLNFGTENLAYGNLIQAIVKGNTINVGCII